MNGARIIQNGKVQAMSVVPFSGHFTDELGDLMCSPAVMKLLENLLTVWPDPIARIAACQKTEEGLSVDAALQMQDAGWIMIEYIDLRSGDTIWLKDVALSAKGKSMITGSCTVSDLCRLHQND